MVINVPVYVHGMVIDPQPVFEPDSRMRAFHARILAAQPGLVAKLAAPIYTCWGHIPSPLHPRPAMIFGSPAPKDDEQLTLAEQHIKQRTEDATGSWNPITSLVAKFVSRKIREPIVLFGLGDVAYYCSDGGEERVRAAVYGQILDALQPHVADPDEIRLHVISHSLGVTVAHDLLYGLFNTMAGYTPGFTMQIFAPPAGAILAFNEWRDRATANPQTLTLGSFTSFASQIPVTLLRKPALVELMRDGLSLNPGDIGVKGNARWQLFYDTKDALAFRTRPLYAPNAAMNEERVDNSLKPDEVHMGYWDNAKVIDKTAALILARS